MASGPLLNDDLASSDLSYLSDIEEEAGSDAESTPPSDGSSALNASELDSSRFDASSTNSESGSYTLDWRAEMTPGTVSVKRMFLISDSTQELMYNHELYIVLSLDYAIFSVF